MDRIIKILNRLGYHIKTKEIDNIEFNYCFIEDRIFFLKNLFGENSLECINNLSIYISETIDKYSYNIFLDNEDITKKDIEVKFLDLRAFLWDIYIIGYINYENEPCYSDEDKSKIERDQFITRKIILEEASEKIIVRKVVSIIRPDIEFDLIFDQYSRTIGEDKIIKNLLDLHLTDENETEENVDLKLRIFNCINKEGEVLKLDDIYSYLQMMKNKLSNFKLPI